MDRAFDTILQIEVSAKDAMPNERYRYICLCCRENVYVAAAEHRKQVVHFKHYQGNNGTYDCDNYLKQLSLPSQSINTKRMRSEDLSFYFDSITQSFKLSVCFSEEDIQRYEQQNAQIELRMAYASLPFLSLPINQRYFAPDVPASFQLTEYSIGYYWSITTNNIPKKYEVFRSYGPTFFKIQGNVDEKFTARIIFGTILFTDTKYFAVFPDKESVSVWQSHSNVVEIEAVTPFETMGRHFYGVVLTIIRKNADIDYFLQEHNYQLEYAETVSLLWPPTAVKDNVYSVESENVYVATSFRLKAHSNINIEPEDICVLDKSIANISVRQLTKIYCKNAELTFDIQKNSPIQPKTLESHTHIQNIFTVPDAEQYFLFGTEGVRLLKNGEQIYLTPSTQIIRYRQTYPIEHIVYNNTIPVSGDALLHDALIHYKVLQPLDDSAFEDTAMSTASQKYLDNCKNEHSINLAAMRLIAGGKV